jgi:hypothetical protein
MSRKKALRHQCLAVHASSRREAEDVKADASTNRVIRGIVTYPNAKIRIEIVASQGEENECSIKIQAECCNFDPNRASATM